MYEKELLRGAKIIATSWLNIKPQEKVLLITDELHEKEMQVVKEVMEEEGATVIFHVAPLNEVQKGTYFDSISHLFQKADAIVGATHYSIATLHLVDEAIKNGKRFLSLPLATNTGRSLISYDFMTMSPQRAKAMSEVLLEQMNKSEKIRATTPAGTDVTLYKKGRIGKFFSGATDEDTPFASSSFEVFVAMEEKRTQGSIVVDGSLGYLGAPEEHITGTIVNGVLTGISHSPAGKKLTTNIQSFGDEKMFIAAEFGIGLNEYSQCVGNSYIEDESAYGTFHLGFGRNIALGGEQEASGHFDLVFLNPNIYFDDVMVIENGKILGINH